MQRLISWVISLSPLSLFEELNPLVLVNHLLQAYFFSAAVCNLIAMILKLVNFAYAEEVASSLVSKLFGVFLLYYLKIWDYYSGILYIASIFSLAIISFYVYDCCGNISQSLDNWNTQHRDLAVIFSFLGMSATTAFIIWQIYENTSSNLVYEYSGIYLLEIILIVIGGLLRRRSIIYSLLGVVAINYLIAARYFFHGDSDQNLAEKAQVPIEYLAYFLMAIDAEKRERDAMQANTFTSLFKTCANLAAYSLLNDEHFELELLLGGIFIFGLVINR